jgi:hypothetical protein
MADFWQGLEWAAAEQGIVFEPIGGPPSGGQGIVATPAGMRAVERTIDRTVDVDEPEPPTAVRRRRHRAALALFGVAAIAGITVGLGLAARQSGQLASDAGTVVAALPDAGAIAARTVDAGLVARLPPDAPAVVAAAIPDAKPVVVIPAVPDAGQRFAVLDPRRPPRPRVDPQDPTEVETPRPPPVGPDTIGHGPNTDVVVTTHPRGGSLYVHGLAAGTDGTTFRRPQGTRMEVRCMFPGNDGWEPTSVAVVFDGRQGEAVCEMAPRTRCVKDLKNPFKKCE